MTKYANSDDLDTYSLSDDYFESKPVTHSTPFITPHANYFNAIKAFIIQPAISLNNPEPLILNHVNDKIPYNFNPEYMLEKIYEEFLLKKQSCSIPKVKAQANKKLYPSKKHKETTTYTQMADLILKYNLTVADLSLFFDMKYYKISNFYNRVLKCGSDYVNVKMGRQRTFTAEITSYLEEFINKYINKFLTMRQIKLCFEKELFRNYSIKLNYSVNTYYKYLTGKKILNYSYKRVSETIPLSPVSQEDYEEKYNYIKRFSYLLNKNLIPVFIDESGINTYLVPINGYSKRNQRLKAAKNTHQSANYTIICATTYKQILGYKVIVGSSKGEDFYHFITCLLNSYPELKTKCFIVLDNSRIHYKKYLYDYFKDRVSMLFLSPYSPHFNSIEVVFSIIKKKLKCKYRTRWFELMSDLELIIDNIKEDTLVRIYTNVLKETLTFLVKRNTNNIVL
jgi:transposase